MIKNLLKNRQNGKCFNYRCFWIYWFKSCEFLNKEKKYRVKAFTREYSFHPFIDQLACEKAYGNIEDLISLKKVLSGIDTIFHTASYISFKKSDFDKAYLINVSGTHNVLEACLEVGVAKVVHLSAGAVLGYSMDKNTILDETSNPKIERDNVYAYTKKLAEEEVQKYVKRVKRFYSQHCYSLWSRG